MREPRRRFGIELEEVPLPLVGDAEQLAAIVTEERAVQDRVVGKHIEQPRAPVRARADLDRDDPTRVEEREAVGATGVHPLIDDSSVGPESARLNDRAKTER